MKIGNYFLLFLTVPTSALSIAPHQIVPKVRVTAKKILRATPSDAAETSITQKEISRTGVANLAQTLQYLAGVQLHNLSGNAGAGTISLRGFGGNASANTLVMVDGVPIINPDLAPPDLNLLPLPAIGDITVLSGSESVLYGDQAVGGVVILNSNPLLQKPTLTCMTGSYQLRQCNFNWHQNNFTHQQTDNYRDHNAYNQDNLLGRVSYKEITLNYQIVHENLQYPGALSAIQVRQNRRQATNHTDFFKDWRGNLGMNLDHHFNDRIALTTKLNYRAMQGDGVLFSPFNQSRSSLYFRPEVKARINSGDLITGLDLQADHYQLSSSFGTTKEKQQQYGLFGLATLPFNTGTVFTLGARAAAQKSQLQENTNINKALVSTLGIKFKFSKNMEYYIRRAENFRFPKADENASTATGKGLQTQRGTSYETGINIRDKCIATKFSIYQLNLDNEIAFDPLQTPQNPFGTNRNLPPTIRRGFDLTANAKIVDKLQIFGQYHYVNARFQNGKRIPLVSEHLMQAAMDYQLSSNCFAYAEALFTGNQYPASDNNNTQHPVGGYTVYNFNLRYESKNLSAAFRVNNIFNKYYYSYTVYQTSMQTEYFYPAPDRNFTLSLSYIFT